ncbi:CACNA1B [Symbiodinium sp. KB8]|nr:CACNA1B [Symbiodinium sp. KB8]
MAAVVLFDAYCTCIDIDATAAERDPPELFAFLSDCCLVAYTLEVASLLVAFGARDVLRDWMMVVDIIIVGCGWAEIIISSAAGNFGFRTAVLRALRLVRIFRLIRLLKKIRPLRELHKLVMMMATCFRTLLWSFLLCFLVMTVWAMLMVETVNPFVRDMHANQGFFEDCLQCRRATSSVMDANLLLFKTVIAGDSWGEVAVPVIQEYPASAFIFVGSQLTLVFGVLNLIVAVVVDTFADARLNDVQTLAEEMEDEIDFDRKSLAKIFDRIDKDGSGQLSLQELIEGARSDQDFQSRLRVMDIDEQDLEQLFHMIDQDQSGTIEVSEFIGPLSRWAHDSKTAPRFIKYNMLQAMHLQEDLYDLAVGSFQQLAARIEDLSSQIQVLKHGDLSLPAAQMSEGSQQDGGKSDMLTSEIHAESGLESPASGVDGQRMKANIEALLESAMSRLETKLDIMLADDHIRPRDLLHVGSGHDEVRARHRTGKKMLHPEAFRSMYLNHGRPLSTAGADSGERSRKVYFGESASPMLISEQLGPGSPLSSPDAAHSPAAGRSADAFKAFGVNISPVQTVKM